MITSTKEVMFLPRLVCLSSCQHQQDNSESYGFLEAVGLRIIKKLLDFGNNLYPYPDGDFFHSV